MQNKTETEYKLIPEEQVTTESVTEVLASVVEHLSSTEEEIHVQAGSILLTLALKRDTTTVSICCGTEVFQPVALIARSSIPFKAGTSDIEQLRLIDELNSQSTGPRFSRCQRIGADSFIAAAWSIPIKSGLNPMALMEAVSLFAVGVCVALEQIDPTEVSDDNYYTEEEKQ